MGKGRRERDARGDTANDQSEDAPKQRIPVEKRILWESKETAAGRDPNGNLEVSFLVINDGIVQVHAYLVGAEGKKRIMDAATGGIAMPEK